MMEKGSMLGYDLNEKNCQISYYNERKDEPETMKAAADNYQIPLVIGRFQDRWIYGKEAKRLAAINEGCTVSDLFGAAMRQEKILLDEKSYEAVWLLAKFVALSLEKFEKVSYLTFSVPENNVDVSKMLKGMARFIGVEKEHICVQDYKESFCHYMFYQPKELWQYEAALFYCDDREIKAYMLSKLNAVVGQARELFVTVEKVAEAQMAELAALFPVMNEDKAKDADEKFKQFIQGVFEKKVISSVYLTGEGFENNWYPDSLRVLCNGRRAFIGNNLYSKGACYMSMRQCGWDETKMTYLDETKMTERICLHMRVGGKECWYPIVNWGTCWYEADGQWEVILEDVSDIEAHVETLTGDELQVEKIPLDGLLERKDYSLRMQIDAMFLDERTCRLTVKDLGFGEFYPTSGFQTEKIIHLGGIHGQFNSMS